MIGIGEVVIRQQTVQTPLGAQHGRQPAGRRPDLAADLLQVGLGEAGHVLGIDQLPGQETALGLEARHGVGLKAPGLLRQNAFGPLHDLPQRLSVPGLRRRAVALLPIGRAGAERLVHEAVVERPGERQQMLDLDRAVKKALAVDGRAGEDADPLVGRQLVEEPQPKTRVVGVGDAQLRQTFPPFRVLALVRAVVPLDLLLALAAQLQFAPQLDHDLLRRTVQVDQGVDDFPKLVERDVDRRIRHTADPLLTALRRIGLGDDMPGQRAAVVGQTRRPAVGA